ncbi:4a-hydroxytetrahydrobiopterin dehydratase [Wenjunlia tyrosinilytica]|uniref:Putative pterin-4-alpha-carbinolamine dehydratase n=1 Tax=Wenjunlia tyrosinilytica TaxID=1544741 RepID=A0A917ZFM0_9ACTN|nr:4a-hydroxytetrahydrobiopterin dehydratase [Wenjunlia tyrosinilytica]GGO81114.1 putative pterin-4-alpha-carbinolamine dehydratase [Wenjunlia tyrosinilytica]
MARRLSDNEIGRHLTRLSGWTRDGDSLRRTVEARDFPTAIAIVDDVAAEAEKMNHHPDIDIRWRTLHFTLSTHSEGGITELDIQLAAFIDETAAAGG